VEACTRGARYFVDDSDDFFNDIAAGKKIVVITALASAAYIPNRFHFNGWLRSLGVRAVFDGAFGGELMALAYRDCIARRTRFPLIASSCPVIVSYCKIYKPELLPYLAPIHSPLVFTAIMIRNFFHQYDDCEIAAVTPCIAKKREFETEGYIKYNVSISNITKYQRKNHVSILNIDKSFFDGPVPSCGIQITWQNGLFEVYQNIAGKIPYKVRAYNHEPAFIYLNELNTESGDAAFVDCNNCRFGCYRGTAVGAKRESIETQENRVFNILKKSNTFFTQIKDRINLFKYYKKDIYPQRVFLSSSYLRDNIKYPNTDELQQIYLRMKKANTSDMMNCQGCGYKTCRDMAKAIFNGHNKVENCRYYLTASLEEKTIEIEKQAVEAQELAQKAMAASDAKAAFLANMSHEIRTPMNAIIGMSTLFPSGNLDDTQKHFLTDIKKMSRSLVEIIDDILDFSKIEAGKTAISPIHFNLRALVDNVSSLSKFLIQNKSLKFDIDINQNVPVWMYGDETRIRQIFTNLISNAIKYTNEGFVRFSVEKIKKDGKELIIAKVTDSGIGIKKEDIDKLFSPFQRMDERKTRAIKGTGLGLVICRQLASLMGGEISVESEYQKGSTFTLSLPFTPGDENLAEDNTAFNSFVRVKEGENVNVLVVDDVRFNIVVTLGFLERHNIKADAAYSGMEALQKIGEKRYDIIFMDHMMPEMDGIETTAKMRAAGVDSPVIALTANAISGVKEQFLNSGMNGFLPKPMDGDELNAVLAKWLPFNKIEMRGWQPDGTPRREMSEFEKYLSRLDTPEFHIDFATGLKHSGGSEETYAIILQEFIDGFPPLISDIEESFNKSEWRNYTIKVHAAKSSFANIGCNVLAERARELEAACRAENTALCIEKTPGFLAESKAFFKALLLLPPPPPLRFKY
jgi:signal transduction histidine kinase/HPt (histidine-containing phosphotransfer) domain-containing protein/ActR/RegA family two-component response regulator